MRTVLDIKYGDFDTSYFDLYLPDSNGFDLVIWFHGGGHCNGSSVRNERGTFDFCDELTKFIKNAL